MKHLPTYLICLFLGLIVFPLKAQTDLWDEILKIEQQSPTVLNRRAVEVRYSLMARQLRSNNDEPAAIRVYEQALSDTYLTSDQHANLAIELAALYNKQLLYKSSYELLQRYPFSDKQKQAWRWTMRLAQTELYRKHYREALSLFNSLASSYPELMNGAELPANRGFAYMALGQLDKAMEDIEMAIANSGKSRTKSKEQSYQLLSLLAVLNMQRGDYPKAFNDINEAMRLAEKANGTAHHDYLVLLRKRAEIALACNDRESATADFTHYWQGERDYICRNFAHMSEQQRLDYWANRKPLVSEAFALEDYAPSLLADIAIFRHQAAVISLADTSETDIQARFRYTPNDIRRSLKAHEMAIEFVKYNQQGNYHYAAILLPPLSIKSDSIVFVPLFSEDELMSFPIGTTTLRHALCSTSANDKNMVYTSKALSEMVWGRLRPFIRDCEVWFAPDGLISLLAIEYLPQEHELTLHRLTSTALLPQRRETKRETTGQKALLVGGLDYDELDTDLADSTSSLTPKASLQLPTGTAERQSGVRYYMRERGKMAYFTYLPGSRTEVDSIAPFVERWDKTYSETEEELKQEFGLFDVVHLSTHGYSLQVDVVESEEWRKDSLLTDHSLDAAGLALSGANIAYRYSSRDDGMLTAREISRMDLSRVDFVVTSSCQSAQGVVSDEGPAGLLRGLKLAGAGTVLASMWPVDDNATTLLMQLFYYHWHSGHGTDGKGCTKTQALRKAQQQLRETEEQQLQRRFNASKLRGETLQTTITPYDAPYFWAPFIIIDDVTP